MRRESNKSTPLDKGGKLMRVRINLPCPAIGLNRLRSSRGNEPPSLRYGGQGL